MRTRKKAWFLQSWSLEGFLGWHGRLSRKHSTLAVDFQHVADHPPSCSPPLKSQWLEWHGVCWHLFHSLFKLWYWKYHRHRKYGRPLFLFWSAPQPPSFVGRGQVWWGSVDQPHLWKVFCASRVAGCRHLSWEFDRKQKGQDYLCSLSQRSWRV